jgi:hypothetical protein
MRALTIVPSLRLYVRRYIPTFYLANDLPAFAVAAKNAFFFGR